MVNPMFHADRAPQRHVEAYQQVLDPQPPHRQDTDAYWADKIAEVMRDQFGIKPKVNTYSYRTPYPPAHELILLPNRYKVPDFTKFSRQDDTSTMEHVVDIWERNKELIRKRTDIGEHFTREIIQSIVFIFFTTRRKSASD